MIPPITDTAIVISRSLGGEKPTKNPYNLVIPGKLTVATSPDFAPYEFYAIDANGNPRLAGFDVALAGYIADRLGLELNIVPYDFDGVLSALQSKKVDLAIAGLAAVPERRSSMDFSEIYYHGGQSFVTAKGNESKFPTLADTNKAEYRIGVQTGSIHVSLAEENSPKASIVQMEKIGDIVAGLLSGQLDGAYLETLVAECYRVNYPGLSIVLDVPYDVEGASVGVSKGNEALLQAVNEAISAAKADGSMNRFVVEANELAAGEIYEGLLDH